MDVIVRRFLDYIRTNVTNISSNNADQDTSSFYSPGGPHSQ